MSGSVGQLTSVHNRADSSGALRGLRMALFFSARLQANRSSPFGLTLLTTTTIFRVSRGAATAAVVLIVLAMFLYPGGTLRDSHTTGYSFSQNFLSDLGMTVTHGGQSNRLGARIFTASFGLLALSLVGCAVGFMRFHATAPRARSLATAGAIGVLIVGAGLLGAAVSPADVSPAVHMRSAALASATAPLALLLFAAASARDRRLPRGVSVAWVVLAVTVAAWFAMRWGPGVDSSVGLTIQATVQKGVALVVVIGLAYQTYQAIRALAAVEGK